MRHALGLLAAGAVALLALGGCGQKGPLYLPEKGAAVVRPPPAAPAVPAAAPETPTAEPAAPPQSTAPGEAAAPTTPAAPKKKTDAESDSQPQP